MVTSFSEAITHPTRTGKGMSYNEAIGYMKELIGSLEQQKLNVANDVTWLSPSERGKMLSALSMKIYSLHVGISCIEREIERRTNGTTPATV
jgi:hypothetical protein